MEREPIAIATVKQVANAAVAHATVKNMEKDLFEWRRDRLTALAEAHGGKAALGRKLGYRDGAFIGQMLRGDRPITEKTIEAWSEKMSGVRDWFSQQPSTPVEAVYDSPPEGAESIRVMKLRLRAGVSGFAAEPDEDESEPIYFRSGWLLRRGFKPYKLVATRVGNHSMEPTLYHDDLVVTNTAEADPIDGEVFSINYEGEPVIKRLKRDGGKWWLTSDNSDKNRYPDKEWLDGSAIIIGRIVHRQSERI